MRHGYDCWCCDTEPGPVMRMIAAIGLAGYAFALGCLAVVALIALAFLIAPGLF